MLLQRLNFTVISFSMLSEAVLFKQIYIEMKYTEFV